MNFDLQEPFKPLEKYFKGAEHYCSDYMFMGAKEETYYYKNIDSRQYLKLNDEGEEL